MNSLLLRASVFRWLICLFFILSCTLGPAHTELPTQIISKCKSLIEDGDLILRTGNDFTSQTLKQLSQQDKTYSHCGIAVLENDSLFIYHALGGEWNPDEKLRRDPVEVYCRPEDNNGFGIFHYAMTKMEIHKLDSIIKAWHKKGITFDMQFDLATDDKMYCAEFVSKAISTATSGRITFDTTRINNFSYVSIDNLFINPYCKQKIKYTFEP